MKNYEIDIEDPGDDVSDKFMVRKAAISSGSKITKNLTKVYQYQSIENDNSRYYINEVYLKKNSQDLLNLNHDNSLSDKFSSTVKRKGKSDKFNIPFVDISWDTPSFVEEKEQISGVLTDFIYANQGLDIINPPKITFPDSVDGQRSFDMYLDFLKTLGGVIRDTMGEHRMSFFIPEHFTRNQAERLLNFYVNEYGEDALIIADIDGKTFNSMSQKVFFILRVIRRNHRSDGFSMYAYNLKARKRSGIAVPSEDLVALYNGISYAGPSHKGMNIPKDVVDSLEATFGKLFFKSDLLYYSYNPEALDGPNLEFTEWARSNNVEMTNLVPKIKRFNSEATENVISSVSEDPKAVLDSLSRPIFMKELTQVSKARSRVMRNSSLNDFS